MSKMNLRKLHDIRLKSDIKQFMSDYHYDYNRQNVH